MRVVILDPSHASEAGHHQELNNALIHGLSGAGHQPEVWVDRALQQAPPYWPGSDAMGYIDPRHWSDLGGCLHLAAKLRQQWHQAQPLQATASAGTVGCWLAHSLLPFQQIAMAQLLQQQRPALVILSLMFPPGERLGGSTADANARCHEHMRLCATAAHQALAQACLQAGHQLLVGSGSAQTLSQHQALWQAANMHELHWHPAVVGAAQQPASSSDDAPSLPTVLLHWGDGKADKGRKEALAVLQALMQRPAAQRPQWQLLFHLHSSQALPEEDEQLLGQAQASLGGQLQLLRERVSTAEMQHLLGHCSLALLAYDPIAYAQRSSGVLWCYAAATATTAAKQRRPLATAATGCKQKPRPWAWPGTPLRWWSRPVMGNCGCAPSKRPSARVLLKCHGAHMHSGFSVNPSAAGWWNNCSKAGAETS